jgi:hypothetical protein
MAGRQKTGKRPKPKTVLRIPDLEQSKYAVLNSRGSIRSQRCFGARQNLCQAPKRRREGELMTCSGRSVAARSPMRGAAWPGDGGGRVHRQECASLVASFAAGVPMWHLGKRQGGCEHK